MNPKTLITEVGRAVRKDQTNQSNQGECWRRLTSPPKEEAEP